MNHDHHMYVCLVPWASPSPPLIKTLDMTIYNDYVTSYLIIYTSHSHLSWKEHLGFLYLASHNFVSSLFSHLKALIIMALF
ncbi:hypothetical protein Sjap_024908 [Stephania japonica]|uniref:Uncharacterized protein n=1 Tax=Stephania japonica TaxID=461633 RepID=A0AAP0EE76_9MAGN